MQRDVDLPTAVETIVSSSIRTKILTDKRVYRFLGLSLQLCQLLIKVTLEIPVWTLGSYIVKILHDKVQLTYVYIDACDSRGLEPCVLRPQL